MILTVKALPNDQDKVIQLATDYSGAQLDAAIVLLKNRFPNNLERMTPEFVVETAKLIAMNQIALNEMLFQGDLWKKYKK